MRNKILNLSKILLIALIIPIGSAIFFNYLYQRNWVSPRYWDETVARSNKRVADTMKNFIYLYGPEHFSTLDPAQITRDYSDLGYNLNIIILKNDQIVAKSKYYSSRTPIKNQKMHYDIDCTTSKTDSLKCSIMILEAINADARNINKNYGDWLKNWVINPGANFESKYNNISWPFIVILSSTFLMTIIIFGWYSYANKKKRILWEIDEARKKAEATAGKAKEELENFIKVFDEDNENYKKKNNELNERLAKKDVNKEEYQKIEDEYKSLLKRLNESKTTQEIRRVFNGIFEKLEFSKAFASNVEMKPNDSVSRKLCEYLNYFNSGNVNPFPNQRKEFKGDISRITDKESKLYEYDIGSKERLYIQLPNNSKPYVTNIDYKHKFSDVK